MPRFRFFPDKGSYGRTERIVRLLALAAVFVLVFWAFSKNNERIIQRLEDRQTISDSGGYLDDRQKSFVKGFREGLHARYGLSFRLKISGQGLEARPEPDSKTIVLLLDPQRQELDLRLPPLVGTAMGKEFLDRLKAEHLDTFWEKDPWQDELIMLLAAIWDRLDELHIAKGSS